MNSALPQSMTLALVDIRNQSQLPLSACSAHLTLQEMLELMTSRDMKFCSRGKNRFLTVVLTSSAMTSRKRILLDNVG